MRIIVEITEGELQGADYRKGNFRRDIFSFVESQCVEGLCYKDSGWMVNVTESQLVLWTCYRETVSRGYVSE